MKDSRSLACECFLLAQPGGTFPVFPKFGFALTVSVEKMAPIEKLQF